MANPNTPHAAHAKLPWRLDPRFVIGMPLRMVDQWREREQKEKETSMPSGGPDGSEEFVPLLKKARPPMPKAKPTLMIPKAKPLVLASGSHGAVRT